VIVPAGDVDGDGLDDVLVAAPAAPMPATWDFVYLLRGGATGIRNTGGGAQILYGTLRNRNFGGAMR
ncbi:MAG: hypothetical protein K8H88_30265, partial [Sandaracinaceae bacterium]|nr:hypothetical protein [Sandaracinaceae bacterium]